MASSDHALFCPPKLEIGERWLSEPGTEHPLNLFNPHRTRRQPKISHQSHERVCLDVS